MSEQMGLTRKKQEDFGDWYLELVEKAGMVDQRYPVKGCDVLMPLGAGIMRRMNNILERLLTESGHKEALFPLFIPESAFKKESKHIKGFEEEVYWVTHAGKNKLDERLVIRPTSETAIYPMFKIWLRSYQDLPLKIFQTVSVFRYETKMTKPLVRMREVMFFNEAHTAHETWDEAEGQVKTAVDVYTKYFSDSLALPVMVFRRPEWDKFPGAVYSLGFDTLMPDGKALQIGTVHNLGENFSKPFEIKFTDEKGKKKFVNQTCYGISARILAALIAVHGDDKGLIIPQEVAPVQIAIVPIYTKENKTKVLEKAAELYGRLEKQFRVFLDDREQYTPGFKFNEWELKGVPLRIEIGPKDLENKQVVLVRRDFRERIPIAEDKLESEIIEAFDSIFFNLKKKAQEALKITDAKDYKNLKEKLKEGGFIRIDFCMQEGCAEKLKEETKAEVRGTLFGKHEKAGEKCAACGKPAKEKVYVARAY